MGSLFTNEEIDAYLEYIKLPSEYRTSSTTPRGLSFLTKLHVHHISNVPFENLPIHYSREHTIDVRPRAVYEKIMSKRGRGGQCMELNYLLTHILSGLGFNVYPTGARVRPRVNGVPSGNYTGWTHSLNIVTFDNGEKYVVDVAFGGDCLTRPLKLLENASASNLGTQEVRYVFEPIVGAFGKQKLWQYQVRNSKEQKWMTHYCFSENVFIANDYEVMNFWTSASPDSFHVTGIFVVKFLMEGDDIKGKIMLNNGTVKENLGGKSKTIKECKTEKERVQALADMFGLELTEDEQKAIQGWVTELHS